MAAATVAVVAAAVADDDDDAVAAAVGGGGAWAKEVKNMIRIFILKFIFFWKAELIVELKSGESLLLSLTVDLLELLCKGCHLDVP